MPITAPTPPTPPTPPQKLESKTNWAVEFHPPVPHFSFGNRKTESVEESEEIEESEEYSEEEVEESESEEVVEEPNPLQVARDRVQTYHRSEDGKSESTSTQSREPLQTNNRIPGEVRPEELTRDAADARGKLIVEQFRKLEEMKDQKESQTQKSTIEIPQINPSDHKSSLGTAIFTFAAILVLVIVAFFTLRKSRLQKHREELNSKTEQKNESIPDPISESNPEPIHVSPKIPATKIKSAYETPQSQPQSKPQSKTQSQPQPPKHRTQLNTELINAKLNEQRKSPTIPTAKIKSVDRNPSDGKTHFEVRI